MTVPAALKAPRRWRSQLDTWAVIAAGAIVLAVVVGTLPRLGW